MTVTHAMGIGVIVLYYCLCQAVVVTDHDARACTIIVRPFTAAKNLFAF